MLTACTWATGDQRVISTYHDQALAFATEAEAQAFAEQLAEAHRESFAKLAIRIQVTR